MPASSALRTGSALVLAVLLVAGCEADDQTRRPGGDDTVLPRGGNPRDGGAPPDAAAPPTQLTLIGGGVGAGTVVGGVLMTSERYKLFGATGQSPGNQIDSKSDQHLLRSGVVGVTP